MTSPVSLRLVLDVTYDPNGLTVDELKAQLVRLTERSIGNGLLTGDSPAEVETHEVKVLEVPEAIEEANVARHLSLRIESGDMDLEDIPVRMARYGMMEPADFVEEMRERMGIEG